MPYLVAVAIIRQSMATNFNCLPNGILVNRITCKGDIDFLLSIEVTELSELRHKGISNFT